MLASEGEGGRLDPHCRLSVATAPSRQRPSRFPGQPGKFAADTLSSLWAGLRKPWGGSGLTQWGWGRALYLTVNSEQRGSPETLWAVGREGFASLLLFPWVPKHLRDAVQVRSP